MSKTIRRNPILITLCCSCAAQFYYANSYRIQRADRHQVNKEECTYCGCRRGYDYLLYPKINEDDWKKRLQRNRKGDACECYIRTAY